MRIIKSKHKEPEAFDKQLRHQKKYFNKEYSLNVKYQLLPWQRQYLLRMRKYLLRGGYQNKTLLDIGAGGGYVSIEMAKRGLKVIALEISEQSIKNLRKYKDKFRLKNLELVLSRAEKLALPDESVEYEVASAVLEHIHKEKLATKEWLRVLKPGGRIYITVPLKYRYLWPFFWPMNYFYDKAIGHLRRYDLWDLERKFKLKTIKVFYTGHFLKTIWVLLSLVFRSEKINSLVEEYDSRLVNRRYGASNISVIFEKI